eukprot:5747701-Prymnesium_polylepis.1
MQMKCSDSDDAADGFCPTTRDGICDDGGPGSTFGECPYGTDCEVSISTLSCPAPPPLQACTLTASGWCLRVRTQDCCPRNPFWGHNSRYTGPLDLSLTRLACIRTEIRLNQTSPCLNSSTFDLYVPKLNLFGSRIYAKEISTGFVFVVLLLFCLVVVLILVPCVVYSQLVYSGLWSVLTVRERFWCMIMGNFAATGQWKEKREDHREHLRQKWSRTRSADLERSVAFHQAQEPMHKFLFAAKWFHFTSTRAWGVPITLYLKGRLRFFRPLGLAIALPIALLIGLAINLVTLEIMLDVLPLSWDTQRKRKVLKALRLLGGLLVMSGLTVYVPEYSSSRLERSLECVLQSCKASNWRTDANELDCKATKAVGIMQPSFWSDLVDVIQASLTLVVLNLIAELRDTIMGKNEIGKASLVKVDKRMGQRVDADGLPKDESPTADDLQRGRPRI